MSAQMNDLFSTPALARNTDPETSKAAAAITDSAKLKAMVLEYIEGAGKYGITMAEVSEKSGLDKNTVSPRSRPLEDAGDIFYQGDTRNGSRIMRASIHDTGVRVCGKCQGALLSFYEMKCRSPKCQKGDMALNDPDMIDQMNEGQLRSELRRLIAEQEKKRTKPQNSSMWLWLTQVATILNDGGIDMVLFLEMIKAEDTKIPATKDSLKLRFWDKIQEHMTGKESSTQLDTKQPDMIYQVACRVLAETFHIIPPPWPDKNREDLR